MSLRALREALGNDQHFARYKKIRIACSRSLPYNALCDELDHLQQARRIRSYSDKQIQPRELLEVSMEEISHRARVTEILKTAKRSRFDLSKVIDAVWMNVYSTYTQELADIKTKGDRERAVSTCFSKGNELLEEIDSLIEQCEVVLKDIDQASFGLSRVANLFELLIRKENLVNVDV